MHELAHELMLYFVDDRDWLRYAAMCNVPYVGLPLPGLLELQSEFDQV